MGGWGWGANLFWIFSLGNKKCFLFDGSPKNGRCNEIDQSYFRVFILAFRMDKDVRDQGECRVCGVTAKIGLHYGAVTCLKCRAFFRSRKKIVFLATKHVISTTRCSRRSSFLSKTQSILPVHSGKASEKYSFLGKSPKLWVGGGQES